ncbi:MAG: heme-binding protein, partial [Dehalococcoidia bacterium]
SLAEVRKMYSKSMLGMEQSQAAIAAMIDEFKMNPSNPPIAMAVVDDVGNLLAYARTDGSRPIISRNAIKKAYTAALRGMSSEDFFEELKGRGWSVADMGDPMLIAVPGGVPVINPGDGAVLGGIGVAGLPPGPGDDNVAEAGLKAMNL